MTRTLIFAGLAAVSLLIPSCAPILGCPSSINSLVQTTAEHYQLEADTYFPAGVYGIPPDTQDEAKKSVGLIVQDIIKFLNDHPRQRFVVAIVYYGFTDETPVKTELISLKRTKPSRNEGFVC